ARLCELNVLEQVVNVCKTHVIRDAWDRGQALTVHGWVYSLRDGRVHHLGMAVDRIEDLEPKYEAALARIRQDHELRAPPPRRNPPCSPPRSTCRPGSRNTATCSSRPSATSASTTATSSSWWSVVPMRAPTSTGTKARSGSTSS